MSWYFFLRANRLHLILLIRWQFACLFILLSSRQSSSEKYLFIFMCVLDSWNFWQTTHYHVKLFHVPIGWDCNLYWKNRRGPKLQSTISIFTSCALIGQLPFLNAQSQSPKRSGFTAKRGFREIYCYRLFINFLAGVL